MSEAILGRTRRYYDGRLQEHGVGARGVDWNSPESQALRFRQLVRLVDDEPGASVLDYGCGCGALVPYLRARGQRGRYQGYDISARMVDAARAAVADPDSRFTTERADLETADVVLASGIFNVKGETGDGEWEAYVGQTLADMASLAGRGFAFNVLSLFSDADRRRPDLYYADAHAWFDHCRRTFSPRVALLHDYPLYEFTLLVRL